MLYNKLKQTAISNYEKAMDDIKESYVHLDEEVAKFQKLQNRSIELSNDVCQILNTIANTPIEIRTNANNSLTGITASYNSLAMLETSTNHQYVIDKLQNMLTNILLDKTKSTNSKLISTGFLFISSAIYFSWENKKTAELLYDETRNIYLNIERAKLITQKIKARTEKIDTILNHLIKQQPFLEDLRNKSYLDIEQEKREKLGAIVNYLLSLSNLIGDKII